MNRAPKRILYVELNEDGTAGGSHQCLFDLVAHLDRRHYSPVVLFYQRNRYVDALRALDVKVHVWEPERQRELPRPGSDSQLGGAVRAVRLLAAIRRRVSFLRK